MEPPGFTPADVAGRLLTLRTALGLSQTDLAKRAKVHRTVIARAETTGVIRPTSLRKICRAVEIPTSWSQQSFYGKSPFRVDKQESARWLATVPSFVRKKGLYGTESFRDESERYRLGKLGLANAFGRLLNIDLPGGRIWSMLVETYRKESEAITSQGQLVLYVLKGRIRLEVGSEEVELSVADAAVLWLDIPYEYESLDGEPATVLEVYLMLSEEEVALRDEFRDLVPSGPDDPLHQGARFRSMRKVMHLQQGEIADRAEVHRTLISRFEHSGVVRGSSMLKLANALYIPASWFKSPFLSASPMRVERASSPRWLATLSSKVRRKNLYGPEVFKIEAERRRLGRNGWAEGFVRLMNLDLPGGRMIVIEPELYVKQSGPPFPGECFVYVLEGRAQLDFWDEKVILEPGDAINFWNDVPFTFKPLDGEPVRYLEVSVPYSAEMLKRRADFGYRGNSYLLDAVDQVQ
jgi:transcriptional regulator with XRE-family HTH domain/quercetin dioxygenase-like cupin family protein